MPKYVSIQISEKDKIAFDIIKRMHDINTKECLSRIINEYVCNNDQIKDLLKQEIIQIKSFLK